MFLILLFSLFLYSTSDSNCVCTTVPCPQPGINTITMGNGGSTISYTYETHNSYPVVISATGKVYNSSLNHGSDTTSCTQKYSRMLDDSGLENCDAGHILANHLGGYGNEPLNIFPQDSQHFLDDIVLKFELSNCQKYVYENIYKFLKDKNNNLCHLNHGLRNSELILLNK